MKNEETIKLHRSEFRPFCILHSSFFILKHGSIKRHCPARRCGRDDCLEGIAGRTGRFRRDQGAHQGARARKWVTFPIPLRRACAARPPGFSAWSSPPSPILSSPASFLPSKTARANSATTSSLPTPTTSPTAKNTASAACFPAAWMDSSFRPFIVMKPRRGFIRN